MEKYLVKKGWRGIF
ncbi:MAG: hypothetical protein ACO1NZ_03335 [Adhaeribacter sp.]